MIAHDLSPVFSQAQVPVRTMHCDMQLCARSLIELAIRKLLTQGTLRVYGGGRIMGRYLLKL
jgi:hypothetical protein